MEDYDYKWTCPTCDTEVEVKTDVNGECPKCHRKYEWDFDGDYGEDSVYIPIWQDAPITQK